MSSRLGQRFCRTKWSTWKCASKKLKCWPLYDGRGAEENGKCVETLASNARFHVPYPDIVPKFNFLTLIDI